MPDASARGLARRAVARYYPVHIETNRYRAGDILRMNSMLFRCLASSGGEMLRAATASTNVAGAGWTQNNCTAVGGSEVTFIAGTVKVGSIISNDVFMGPLAGISMEYDVYATGNADHIEMGVIDAALPASTTGSVGLNFAGAWSVLLDIYNNRMQVRANGVAGATAAYNPESAGNYVVWRLSWTASGSNVVIQAFQAGTSRASFTVAAPTFTRYRLAIAARSGGQTGTFKARDYPSTYALPSGAWERFAP